MPWLKLTLESSGQCTEHLVNILERFCATSISLSRAGDEKIFTATKELVIWQRTLITALIHQDTDLDTLLVCLYRQAGEHEIGKCEIAPVENRDWIDNPDYGAITFSDCLCVCPSWCKPAEDNIPAIYINPGFAFGTGAHATTAACLRWLTSNNIKGKTVIDYGCGSGILALAAIKLGAAKVYAVDIDRQALKTTRENAEKNNIADTLTVAAPDDIELPGADILVANILMNPLQKLAQRFADLVKTYGDLVLSGLLATQAQTILEIYADWFAMDQPVFTKEWSLLHGIRE